VARVGASAAPHPRNAVWQSDGRSPHEGRADSGAHALGDARPAVGNFQPLEGGLRSWQNEGLASVGSPKAQEARGMLRGEMQTVLVRALFEYQGTTETELDLRENDVVTVLKQDRSGWWQGEVDGRIGWFPFNYVQVLS